MKHDPEFKNFYKAATKKILARIEELGLAEQEKQKARKYVKLFRNAFLLDSVKKAILGDKYNPAIDSIYDSTGFCRISSVAFAAVMGAGDWDLMCINKRSWAGHANHHYLKHIPTGKIVDLTYDQFVNEVPYEKGRSVQYKGTINTDGQTFATAAGVDLLEILKENSRQGK